MIGKVLGNRYEILEKIGGGGMAVVYKAKCRVLNRFVAIKIMRQEFNNDEEFIEKFKQESLSAASLTHANIVSIYDTGEEDNIYYIVMEYVKGITLKEYIKEKGTLDENEAIKVSKQIAEALEHAHKNKIIHRDIKPHNILIKDDGIVKVADFGIARAANTSTINNATNIIGSVHYFSPEQARGGYVDEKSDIYSLGVVMYEMVTGEVPFDADNHVTVAMKHVNEKVKQPTLKNENISNNFENIILKCLEKKQGYRFNNIKSLLDSLNKVDLEEKPKTISDSPTIIMPKITDELSIEKDTEKEKALKRFFSNKDDENGEENVDEVYEKERKSKIKASFAAIFLALIITSILTFFAFRYVKEYLAVNEVTVPQLIDMPENEARDKIVGLGLKFNVKERVYNPDFAEGTIIYQSIKAGTQLKEKFPIDVIVSLGEKQTIVPNLSLRYTNEAGVLIKEAGLSEGEIAYEFSEEVPEGLVISQDPEEGIEVSLQTKVNYIISKGPEVEYRIMPNLVGKNIEDAKSSLLSRNFNIGEITYDFNDEYDIDEVIYQSYPANQEIEEYTSISLIVSKGPKPIEENPEEPNTTGSGIDENDDGDSSSTAQLLINLPDDRDHVMVTIENVTNGNRRIVYQERHETSEKSITVNVKGTGEQDFEIFIDSDWYTNVTVEFGE